MNVLCAESVFVVIFEEILACVNHKDAGAMFGVLLVNHDNTCGDASAVEQIGR